VSTPKRPAAAPVRAAIYVRISSDRTGGGLGVERQEADCRDLAARLGWDVAAVYADNDVSAYSGAPRPGYLAMLDDVKAGRVQAVVAWHTDRLHRRTLELEEFVALAESHDLQVQTVRSGQVDLSTASGRMVARMLGAAAQHEVDHARERMKRAKVQAAKDGKYRGGKRPYGFERDGVTHREEEADVIRHATKAVLAGRSLRAVCRDLNAEGHLTSGGKEWGPILLRDVLLRARNAGLIAHGTANRAGFEVIGTAQWEPVVDEDSGAQSCRC
jgi:site-specific DNA recombinase